MKRLIVFCLLAIFDAPVAAAPTLDGTLDASYGAPWSYGCDGRDGRHGRTGRDRPDGTSRSDRSPGSDRCHGRHG